MNCYKKIKEIISVFPENIALRNTNSHTTYKELGEKIEYAANILHRNGIKSGDVVAIISENKPEFVVFMLSVWKLGGIVLLLDNKLPSERINYMLDAAQVKFLISDDNDLLETVKIYLVKIIINFESNQPILPCISDNEYHLAYIFFTSGSTGNPKGVLASHKSLLHFLHWQQNTFSINSSDKCLQLTRLSFDVILRSVFTALISGAEVVFPNSTSEVTNSHILNLLEQYQISYFHVVPSLMKTWILQDPVAVPCSNLKYIFFAGEKLEKSLVENVRKIFLSKNLELINLYGPTETILAKCFYRVSQQLDDNYILPVGSPIDNTQVYLVDKNHIINNAGETGEIVIETEFKSEGYLNNKDIFKQIANSNKYGYYTGDLGFFDKSGKLFVSGRIDEQIKINGVRIEPTEIDYLITTYVTEINQAATYYSQQDEQLICYFTAKQEISLTELHNKLKNIITQEMLPNKFILVDSLLYNSSGKLDRRNLFKLEGKELKNSNIVDVSDQGLTDKLIIIFQEVFLKNNISTTDNFFSLGGNSLKAAIITNKIRKHLFREISVRELFEHPILGMLANYLVGIQLQVKKISELGFIENPLISEQAVLASYQLLHPNSAEYNVGYAFNFSSISIKDVFLEKLFKLIEKINLMNYNIQIKDELLYFQVSKRPNVEEIYLKDEENVLQSLNYLYAEPLNVEKQLFRVVVFYHNSISYVLIIFHHTIIDGESSLLLFRSIEKSFNGIDFFINNTIHQPKTTSNEKLDFWSNYLINYSKPLGFDDLYVKKLIDKTSSGSLLKDIISTKVTEKIFLICAEENVTEFVLFFSVFAFLCSRFSRTNNTVVGIPINNRNLYYAEQNTFGCFVKTLPFLVDINNSEKFLDYIQKVNQNLLHILDNLFQESLTDLIHKIDLSKQIDVLNLFDFFFSYDHEYLENLKFGDAVIKRIPVYNNTAKFPVSFMLSKLSDNTIEILLEYDNSRYSEPIIKQFINSYKYLLNNIERILKQPIAKIQYTHSNQLYTGHNYLYDKDDSFINMVYHQVQVNPDSVAIKYKNNVITYKQLWYKVVNFSNYLKEKHKNKGSNIVAVFLPKSIDVVVSMLAIYEAGLIYMPIEIGLPPERIQMILDDATPNLAICGNNHIIFKTDAEIIKIEDVFYTSAFMDNYVTHFTDLDSPAYLLYTSGTQGRPKGVLQTHRTIVNLIHHQKQEFAFLPKNSIVAQSASIGFDVSIQEITYSLAIGNTLLIIDYEEKTDPQKFWSIIARESVNILFIPPAVLQLLAEYLDHDLIINLRYIVVAGEALKISSEIRAMFKQYPECKLVNHYGPTETHVVTSYLLPENIDAWPELPSIGFPLANCGYLLLDENYQITPFGVIGELCIFGDSLAKGYYNNKHLTDSKFIELNINSRFLRLYKSGDLVRQNNDNALEYIGRNDSQVQINGYRVELAEIENQLLLFSQIRQSKVVFRENSKDNKYLVCYYISTTEIDEQILREYLIKKLPEYMIPNYFIHLSEAFPLTMNGKIDYKNLPQPQIKKNHNYVGPRNAVEHQICKLWSDLLKIQEHEISIDDDFFRCGGNSLLAIRLVSKINNIFPASIRLADFLLNQSISKISNLIENIGYSHENKKIDKVLNLNNRYELSYAQQRLWFIDQYTNGTDAYNISMLFKFKFNTNKEYIKLSIRHIIRRHEILRSLIKQDNDGQIYQTVLENDKYEFNYINKILTTHEFFLQELSKDVHYRFDLNTEIPIRVSFYMLSDEQYISIVIHHIAFDGWSIDIFLHELIEYYSSYINQIAKNIEIPIPNLPDIDIQYKDFALWQRQYLDNHRLDTQFAYWKNKLEGYETLNLITDKPRPVNVDYSGDYVYFELNQDISQQLILLAKLLDVSLYSVLISAYYLLLSGYSNQEDITIGTSVANRHYPQVENLIGFFVNNLALRINIDNKQPVVEFIKNVGATVINAQLHQDLPFEQLVSELKIAKDNSRHPIFQVVFEMLNSHSEQLKLESFLQIIEQKIYKTAKFDLTLTMSYSQNKIMGNFNYQIALFERKSIDGFIQTYQFLLTQFAALLDNKIIIKNITIANLEFTSENIKINTIDRPFIEKYNSALSINQIFEKQVQMAPHKIALKYGKCQMSYIELNEKANQLAHYLIEKFDIHDNQLIAICGRNEYTIISILAILKVGCAYVPIDITNPEQRIAYIINDTKLGVILGCSEYIDKLQSTVNDYTEKKSVILDLRKLDINYQRKTNLDIAIEKTDLAYVIYTSGTTGNPKGVMIEQRNVINYLYNINALIMSNQDDIVDFSTNIAFDLTVTCTLGALCSGSTISIYTDDIRDIQLYTQHLIDNQVNIIKLVPSYFELLCDFLPNTVINKVILGGEKLTNQLLEKVKKNNLIIIDEYGPTEATVGACFKPIIMDNYDNNKIHSIGLAYAGYSLYILDEELRHLPCGAVSELYIGGCGVSRGYLNSSELTQKSFINNNKVAYGERLYKTGDLVRLLHNGELEYIGRKDSQVKLNGYRIDLNEIAAQLLKYPRVKQAIAVMKGKFNKNSFITAYYTSDHILDQDEIMQQLITVLPEYMIPKAIVWLQEIPLTANGKINENELPMPELPSRTPYVMPTTDLEKQIRLILANILQLKAEEISIIDDFFSLGGNSIQAIIFANRLSNIFNKTIKVIDIFAKRSVKALAGLIQSNNSFELVVKLNSAKDKKKLFMIHPAIGGCEVYQELAYNLQNYYCCYGVDSYNLYHENKITNLKQLAQLYLSEIEKVFENSEDDDFSMLGWSFGGQIAIEIAGLLEQKGKRNISIILLDTVIFDDKLHHINDSIDENEFKINFENYMLSQNHEKAYIDRIIRNIKTEFGLIKYPISYKLKYTKLLLYKAMQPDTRYTIPQSKLIDQYIRKLKHNNIDMVISNFNQLTTISLENAHHGNILKQQEILSFVQHI